MSTKSFYEAESAEEMLEKYLEGHRHLYAEMKALIIKRELDRFLGPGLWKKIKIAEIGAGGGIWTKYFLEKGADVTCIDILKTAVEANQKSNPKAKHILGDATSINLNEKFDLIFMKDLIEHVQNDEGLLKNMFKHLKENGLLLINTQNSFSLNYLIQSIYYRFIKKNRSWLGWDPTHVRFYNYWMLKRKLSKIGFKPIKWYGDYFFPYRLITNRIGGKKAEKRFLHPVEMLHLSDKFPISITGWGIGVIAKKQ